MKCCRIAGLLVLVWSLGITPVFGAWYIKFAGIDGEATDVDHREWCELQSMSQGMRRLPATEGDGRVGALQISDIVGVKELDKASPKLAEALSGGKVIPEVQIHLTMPFGDGTTRKTYLAYQLTNVQITSYELSGNSGASTVPIEEFSLNFEEIKVTYTQYDSAGRDRGSVEYTWKVEEGKN